MIYKKILLISLLVSTKQQFGLITIVNNTPWSEKIFFNNKRAKKIGSIVLKANEGICFGRYSHPIFKKTVAIKRKLKIWEMPQDSNPGEPEPPTITLREEGLTDTTILQYAKPLFLHITTLFTAKFKSHITLNLLQTTESISRQHQAKYINLDKYIKTIG